MSKEKQIEEMAKDLCDIECKGMKCGICDSYGCEYRMQAEALYNAGYRKQIVGEWKFEFNLDDDDFYKCSVCGRQEVINGLCKERNPVEHYPYCHCGAKMKGGAG